MMMMRNHQSILTWSIACIEKLKVMNSQIGFRPANAAPTAIPAKPISVMGVSITRLSPYFFHKPLKIWYTYTKHFVNNIKV